MATLLSMKQSNSVPNDPRDRYPVLTDTSLIPKPPSMPICLTLDQCVSLDPRSLPINVYELIA